LIVGAVSPYGADRVNLQQDNWECFAVPSAAAGRWHDRLPSTMSAADRFVVAYNRQGDAPARANADTSGPTLRAAVDWQSPAPDVDRRACVPVWALEMRH
jgi:hypothetical protein